MPRGGIETLRGAAHRFPHWQRDTKQNSPQRPEEQGILPFTYTFIKQYIHFIYTFAGTTAGTHLS